MNDKITDLTLAAVHAQWLEGARRRATAAGDDPDAAPDPTTAFYAGAGIVLALLARTGNLVRKGELGRPVSQAFFMNLMHEVDAYMRAHGAEPPTVVPDAGHG